ncbi:hypothetical protein Tco_0292274 [Tanacetum coccineum]
MDDPNITIEEYIRLEEEKAQRVGRSFNWQTATYGKVKYYEDEDDCFTDFESEFPAIVFDDTSDAALSCEPTVSPLNDNKIDFRISFDESDDEDYTYAFVFDTRARDKDNDIDEIDIEQSSEDMSIIPLPNVINTDDGAYALRDLTERKEEIGGVFIIWNSRSVGVLTNLKEAVQHILARKLNLENYHEQTIREFSVLILFFLII